MTEEEARALLRAHGWGYLVRKRKKGRPYIYAVRREKRQVVDRYIAPVARLPHLTEAEVVAKLTKDS